MKKALIIIVILIILAAGGIFAWKARTAGTADTGGPSAPAASETAAAVADQLAGADLTETYDNAAHRFSLSYPKGLKTQAFPSPDGQADVVLIADLASGVGVQIYISSSTSAYGDITAARLQAEVPDLTVRDPQEVLIGSSGKGLAFVDGEGAAANRQIWFAAGTTLYQLTAPMAFDRTLQRMMNTWKFY